METGEKQGIKTEWLKCSLDVEYFIHEYVMILNATNKRWEPFHLWPAQGDALRQMCTYRLLAILKARQLGLSWLALGYGLWCMLFWPIATFGIFSQRETDAQELLDIRLKGMYERLPRFMQAKSVVEDNKTRWELSSGSTAMAFATTAGRQYTFSLVMVDEADYQPDLPKLLTAVEPTVDAGGQMLLISTVDKGAPMSRFKSIYRAAKAGTNDWSPIFLPWHARPERTPEWYAAQKADSLANTSSLDEVHQEYPETDTEALSPRSLDKRIPAPWIEACYSDLPALDLPDAPSIPGLEIFVAPDPKRAYVIGADPAEGNPGSDDSAATVVDAETGEECARLRGKIEPGIFGSYLIDLSVYYRNAGVLVERQNHGHAVILFMRENSAVRLLRGHDGKTGWMSSTLGKHLVYNETVEVFRDGAREGVKLLHSFDTYTQLASIEGATLRAPDGMHDDLADSFAFAQAARNDASRGKEAGTW